MKKIAEVKTLPEKKIFIKYSNGMEGVISLQKMITRDEFTKLKDIDVFENVRISENSGNIIINDKIELCKNAVYGILDLKKQMASIGLKMGD